MYINKQIKAGDFILIKKFSLREFGSPGHKRKKRQRSTPIAMDNYNRQRKAEKLQMLILNNFDKGFHVILDYPKDSRPETYEEAEKILMKSLYKISRRLKKDGKEFKYIAITERGHRAAALHHHLIVEGDSLIIDELRRAWGQHMHISPMYEEGAYKQLAEYFCKIETKEEQTKGKSKYHRSRNLKEPECKVAFCAGSINKEPLIPKGYDLIIGSYVDGFNEIVGVRYQKYMLRKSQVGIKSESVGISRNPISDQKGNKISGIFKKFKGFIKGVIKK